MGWDSVGGKVACYWLNSLGMKSQWGWDFLHLSRLALGST